MGLDNGIILRTNTKLDVHNGDEDCYELPDYIALDQLSSLGERGKFQYTYEVCYFRKSWAFRDMVFSVLDNRKDAKDNGITELTKDEVLQIRDGLLDFFRKPEEWNDGAQVFYMDQSIAHVGGDALNLGWLAEWMDEHPHDLVYFYDSY